MNECESFAVFSRVLDLLELYNNDVYVSLDQIVVQTY